MKKIIATVLAMVMALALCTVAFADVTYTKVDKVPATASVAGHPEYYTGSDGEKYLKSGDTYKVMDDATAEKYTMGYYVLNLVPYATAKANTCTENGYKVSLYQSEMGSFYAKAADVDAYNDANPTDTSLTNLNAGYFGNKFETATKYYWVDDKNDAVYTGAHALYKTSDLWGDSDAVVYKCAICGGTFVKKSDITSTKDDVSKLAKISYTSGANLNVILNSNGLDVTKALPGTDLVMYTVTAGKTETTDKNTSPKTFDAGIAMYVGMALTSVAGSAVVIGKKKEF